MVGAIRAAAPYRVGSRLIPRPDGPSLVVSARLLEGRFAGTVLRQNRTVVSRSPQTFEIRASAPTAAVSAAQPLLPLALLGVAAVGLGAGLWRLRRRRLAPPPMSRDAAVTHARSPLTTVPAPLIRQTAGEAAADRFRLAIDFSDRQAMLDFVDLLKRDELLPSTAQAQPVDAAAPVLSPATETYVVTRREADGSPRPTA